MTCILTQYIITVPHPKNTHLYNHQKPVNQHYLLVVLHLIWNLIIVYSWPVPCPSPILYLFADHSMIHTLEMVEQRIRFFVDLDTLVREKDDAFCNKFWFCILSCPADPSFVEYFQCPLLIKLTGDCNTEISRENLKGQLIHLCNQPA